MGSNAEYYRIADMASHCLMRREFRRAADLYWESYRLFPSPWIRGRYYIFANYTTVLTDMYFTPSDQDFKNLRRVLDGEKEPALFRVDAGRALGVLCTNVRHDYEDAADTFRQTIGIADGAKESELRKQVLGKSGEEIDVRAFVEHFRDSCSKNLASMESSSTVPLCEGEKVGLPAPVYHTRSDGSVYEIKPIVIQLPEDTTIQARAFKVGGTECDVCHKSLAELGIPRLSACIRCKLAYYCSKECQRSAWKQGHKVACREPQQRVPGDIMKLQGLEKELEHDKQLVTLVAERPNGQWQVDSMFPAGTTFVVDADRLVHIRPEK